MKTFAHLKKRNRAQRFTKKKVLHQQQSVFHLENSIHLNIPTPKRSSSNPQKTSILQEQANAAFLHPTINHIYREDGRKETMASLLRGPEKSRWSKALSNEIGRLAQGNKYGVKATDTIEFIKKENVPNGRAVTYASFVCDHRPLKTEQWRVRCVAGGDKLPYPDDPASPAANLLDTKLLLNSTISDAERGARFLSADLKDHFLASKMGRPEYMRIPIKVLPQDIIDRYSLLDLVDNQGYVYVKINKGMYGLKQAALLAYNKLVNHLAPFGYHPLPFSLGLWTHETRKTTFCLCVDDFGVKYFSLDDAEHLISALQEK